MNPLVYRIAALTIGTFLLPLAGCVAPSSPVVTPVPDVLAPSHNGFRILANFDGTNGSEPDGVVIFNHGIYGTALEGGAEGAGVLYKTSSSGHLKALHAFDGTDGSEPTTPTADGNALYGTTFVGGASGLGTAYKYADGQFTKLADFLNNPNYGAYPNGLTILHGSIYGTTLGGGTAAAGTVFVLTSSGIKTIYDFPDDEHGALEPSTALVACDGALYGTTNAGGAYGDGTVYKVTTSGQESLIYSFGGTSADGAEPLAGPLCVGDRLYGTTFSGGTTSTSTFGGSSYGTVFEIASDGREHVVYRFSEHGRAGFAPRAGLLYFNGLLYGTTSGGGAHGAGAIFSLKLSGTDLRVLDAFPASLTSARASSTLVQWGVALYGTTIAGGRDMAGTLFRALLR